MSRVMYDGKRIIPAPLVTITKTYQKAGNGDIIGKLYTLSITGTLVTHMGSPDSTGTFWEAGGYPADESVDPNARLAAIMRKQEALRNLFSVEGKAFEIQSADGSQPMQCYPRVLSIEFPEDIWYDRCNYTISLECDELLGDIDEVGDNFTEYIESATEEWGIDTNEDPQTLGESTTYSLSHNISAVGKKFYNETGGQDKEPWEYAQDYVLARLGYDTDVVFSSGVHNLPDYYAGWNHRRTSQTDKQGGGFSVTENWLLASGTAIETFSINTVSETESPHQRVTIQGTVTGFEQRDSDMQLTTSKWVNAQDKFTWASGVAYLRAETYSNISLNIEPLSITVGRNPLAGTIDYSMDYDTRPIKLIEGAKSESISIGNNIGGEMFASVFVLGRARGPVLQDLGTKPANTRSLSIEIVVDPPQPTDRTLSTMQNIMIDNNPINNPTFSGNLNTVVAAANPLSQGFTTVFQEQPQDNWDFINGRFSYNTSWTYE